METLYLFSSTRSMKCFFAQNYAESFLPATKSIGEFLEFVLRVEGKRKIPNYLRQYYLYKAISATDTQKLGEFAKNFTQFLQNSSFFLKFYDELCAECVEIRELEKLDIYAFYDDHIQVLESVFRAYQKLLEKHHFFDHYFLQNYAITFELLAEFSQIVIQIDGFLTRFEVKIFKEISKQIPISFLLRIDTFNQDYYQKLFSLTLEFGAYTIVLGQGSFSITDFKEILPNVKNLEILEFQDKIAEVGGIFSQIDIWLKQGVLPEQISVILPNESFIEYLKLFDKARNFNFAMGESLSALKIYERLVESKENFSDFASFEAFLIEEIESEGANVCKSVQETLSEFKFSLPYLESLEAREQILVFLEMLKEQSLDDVGGGRISVMGILETRGVHLEYVIIPEFNASNVPSISDKDIFLNTQIRENVGLPTRKNRENLQKHYYATLLDNAKESRILCLNNDVTKPSRFLLEDSIFGTQKPKKTSLAYSEYFISGKPLSYKEQQIIAPLGVESFSATSLECFLTCKRKFYYRYILGLKAEALESVNIGSKIHEALKEVYSGAREFDEDVLYKRFCECLSVSFNAREHFESELAKKYLKRVFALEQERLKDGWIPTFFESGFSFDFGGFALKGRIDRIDKKGNELLVLDYKYKRSLKADSLNYEKSSDFQLPIYYLATKTQNPNCNIDAGFYDLYSAEIVKERDLATKVGVLEEKLKEIKQGAKEVDFSLAQKRNACKFCDFIYLCNRY
ncbi:PD-(D/E)XK nuclease family protein [Helicobacter turcicus]|uniref:PD-(D/E)XK nuclease family protein n=1 Tax=Helicobacter turcicus TaxID=2867412 RepID=A0ABS7JLE4_9HELI|nr:PD-(D/E)XK nuclease family protein [Helicobacter turcicus]MBX7490213.1 PD-(D/E)XK nuclease family protein [Helicobacter turcicus]MBX7545208.1 PD-(D/E)XK nuclease family protein [Helicobacter turcicus]